MDLLGALSSDHEGPDVPPCSRKGCTAHAAWQVKWNNPKIHPQNGARCGWRATTTASGWRTSSKLVFSGAALNL